MNETRSRRIIAIALFVLILASSACGQKGDLYLPNKLGASDAAATQH